MHSWQFFLLLSIPSFLFFFNPISTLLFVPPGKSNPYCEVTMGAQIFTSRTLNDTLNPKWNFNCQIFIKDLYQDVLCITVFEKDQFSPDGQWMERNIHTHTTDILTQTIEIWAFCFKKKIDIYLSIIVCAAVPLILI